MSLRLNHSGGRSPLGALAWARVWKCDPQRAFHSGRRTYAEPAWCSQFCCGAIILRPECAANLCRGRHG